MKNSASLRHLVCCAAVSIVLATIGCDTLDVSGRNKAIESAANKVFGVLRIPTGPQLRLTGSGLAYLKKAESAGLVNIRGIPQGYWDAFLNRTQGMGTPFAVVATPKLSEIALNPNSGGNPRSNPNYTAEVRVSESKIDKVLTDDEYKGPLATPGEKYRLVLGTLKSTPTAVAAVVGQDLAKQEEYSARFRCVVKYSEFTKEWSVIALDLGSVDPERWHTANVK